MPKHLGGLWKNVPWQKRMDLEMPVPGILLLPSATGKDRLAQPFRSAHSHSRLQQSGAGVYPLRCRSLGRKMWFSFRTEQVHSPFLSLLSCTAQQGLLPPRRGS